MISKGWIGNNMDNVYWNHVLMSLIAEESFKTHLQVSNHLNMVFLLFLLHPLWSEDEQLHLFLQEVIYQYFGDFIVALLFLEGEDRELLLPDLAVLSEGLEVDVVVHFILNSLLEEIEAVSVEVVWVGIMELQQLVD